MLATALLLVSLQPPPHSLAPRRTARHAAPLAFFNGLLRRARRLPSEPASRPLPGGASASLLRVVAGDGLRGKPEQEPIYAYFNYSASPFYAALDAAPEGGDASVGVRWLRLGDPPPANEFRAVFNAGRRETLQQIYDEALKEDRRKRR